jgi:type IV pilus assembly protein PilA
MHILSILKDRLNRDRMESEQGFTLIELLIVIVILGILAAIAVPTYLSFVNSSHTAAAESNVRTAIPAAEDFYQLTTAQGGGNQSYTGMTLAKLQAISPGISSNLLAESDNTGLGYCIQDTEPGTNNTWSYAGGSSTMASAYTADADTLENLPCATLVTGGSGLG